jgi:hypothetical protein
MNIIGWNCRGMRKSSAVQALLELQGRLKPDVLFLSEAHLSKVKAERLKVRLKFDNMLVSESDGRSGGLVLYWNNDLKVTSFEVSKKFIDIRIKEDEADGWRLTGVYGEPSGDRKHLTWDCLRSLYAIVDLPWMMLGDCNEILYGAEKDGGNQRPQRCMQAFRDTLSFCNLEDMGFSGDIFTWRRGKIRERLDRAVCDPRWAAMFPLHGVINEDFGKSDHRPIRVCTELNDGMHNVSSKGPLRFEARWLCEESIESIIQTAWERAKTVHADASLRDHTQEVHDALHAWDKEVLKGPRRRLRELQSELNEIMAGPLSDEAVSKQREIQLKMENLLEQEELYWVQRGRVNWLKHGDQNTAFFHRSASARRKRNFIKGLKNDQGVVVEDQGQLCSLAASYFENLFYFGGSKSRPDGY